MTLFFFLSANNNSACCRALRGRSPSRFQFFADMKAASILWRQRKVILETWQLDISRFSWFDRCSFYTFMFVNVSAWDGSRPPPSLDEIEVDGRFVLPTMKNSAMTWQKNLIKTTKKDPVKRKLLTGTSADIAPACHVSSHVSMSTCLSVSVADAESNC